MSTDLKEYWIIKEKGFSTWVSDKPLFSADTDQEIHVREVSPEIDLAIGGMIECIKVFTRYHGGDGSISRERLIETIDRANDNVNEYLKLMSYK